MNQRPYVTLSAAMSLDGYLDCALPPRVVLSNAADLDRVDGVRARHDAILVGARTVRKDNPRLVIRSEERRLERELGDHPSSPTKVTVTATGDLDPRSAFFTVGDSERLVYCPRSRARGIQLRLGAVATVVPLGADLRMSDLLDDLGARGVSSLMVEGGGMVLTQFLEGDLADELHLAIAPFFIGDSRAPRLVRDGAFPFTSDNRAMLVETHQLDGVVVLRYALSARFERMPAVGRVRTLATA